MKVKTVTIACTHVPRIVLRLHSLVNSKTDCAWWSAPDVQEFGCDTFSEHVGKEIKDATGKLSPDVQPFSVISLNVLNYLTQQQNKLFDPFSAGLFGYE